jgi:Met-zincin/Domain of unknown function (DUF5117)/Domain of unknown function (DUF5118)
MIRSLAAPGLVALCLAACSRPEPARNPAPGDAPGRSTPARQDTTARVRRYSEVITARARTDSGLFHVHMVGDRLYFEVPDSLMGREMLLLTSIAGAPSGLSGFLTAGSVIGEQVLRWERRGDRVILRKLAYENVASDSLPVSRSVRSNNFEPIIQVFDVRAENADSSTAVIEMTDFFKDDVPAISGLSATQRTTFRVRRVDPRRSLIDYARSYPMNVEVRHTQSFDAAEPPSDAATATISMQLHQSMVLLPREPMRVRYADRRVGWFTINQVNFGLDEQKAATRSFIQRWRLEPRDPAAYARGELVEPVKPIVYYLDPATPMQYRRWVRLGIEDWQGPFEAAGFRNAILARDPPTEAEDPEFSPEDVRYSTVRWTANLTRNAVGPSVADPRSGEIIDSDIIWYHNHLRSYRNRLLLETAAANPAARTLRMPDSLLGEAIRAVIAHEIGHALGLPHNMIASSAYPVDSLRSGSFTRRMGLTPTIMDYARQNYVAQPGDTGVRFIRTMGPYDDYVISWGYRVIPGVSPEGEKPTLDRWIREHAGDPMYRFGEQRGGLLVDPRNQTEDLGNDPVAASRYAIANLKRVVPNLVEWTSTPGESYADLNELYGELLAIWNTYTGHVITVIGGVEETLKASDESGPVFVPVPRARQREALQFLLEQVFHTPVWLQEPEVLRRIEHAGAVDRMRGIQVNRLNQLLDPGRMQRLIEQEIFDSAAAYRLLDFMDDLKDGIWSELAGRGGTDPYRRNLQRAYIERLEYLLKEEPPVATPSPNVWRTPVDVSQSDIRPVARAQLGEIRQAVQRRLLRGADQATRAHLEDVIARIREILEPNGATR